MKMFSTETLHAIQKALAFLITFMFIVTIPLIAFDLIEVIADDPCFIEDWLKQAGISIENNLLNTIGGIVGGLAVICFLVRFKILQFIQKQEKKSLHPDDSEAKSQKED